MNRRVGFGAVVAAVFSAPAYAQDESTRALAERICQNQADSSLHYCIDDIEELYERMNRAFVDANRALPQVASDADQQRWLAELRKNCTENICMRDTLARRIIALRTIEMRSYDVAETAMTDAEAKDVCENVAAVESRGGIDDLLLPTKELKTSPFEKPPVDEDEGQHDGHLQERFTLELHKGHPRNFGVFMGAGTCVMFSIDPTQKPDTKADDEWPVTTSVNPEAEDELHLIGWGGGESVLAYGGRYYVATYGNDRHGIRYLEWLTPAESRRGLCTFEDDGVERIVTARLDPHADCDALARTPADVLGSVDLDNDGEVDSIQVDGEDSGAGCGRSWRAIKFVNADGDAEVSPRNEALQSIIGLERGPVMLLTLKNKEYVYGASATGTPTVYSVTKTGVVPQCEFRIQYKRRVKSQFSFTHREPDEP